MTILSVLLFHSLIFNKFHSRCNLKRSFQRLENSFPRTHSAPILCTHKLLIFGITKFKSLPWNIPSRVDKSLLGFAGTLKAPRSWPRVRSTQNRSRDKQYYRLRDIICSTASTRLYDARHCLTFHIQFLTQITSHFN